MVLVARAVVALAAAGFFAAPLYADVIPTRYGSDGGAAQKVEARLAELGMDAQKARAHALQLTDDEAVYFAWNPARLQFAGCQEMFGGQSDNFWWEWIIGIGSLGGAAALIYFVAFD